MAEDLLSASLSFPTLRRKRKIIIANDSSDHNNNNTDQIEKRQRQIKREHEEAKILQLTSQYQHELIQWCKGKDLEVIRKELLQQLSIAQDELQKVSLDKDLVRILARRGSDTPMNSNNTEQDEIAIQVFHLFDRVENLKMEERIIREYCTGLLHSNTKKLQEIYDLQASLQHQNILGDLEDDNTPTQWSNQDIKSLEREKTALTAIFTELVLESGVDWNRDLKFKRLMGIITSEEPVANPVIVGEEKQNIEIKDVTLP
jgi:hypothetical protein